MLHGECYCGTCHYEVADNFEYAMYCHCSQCRRMTGSAYWAFGGIRIDQIRLTAGESEVIHHGDSSAHNVLCGRCGSVLYGSTRGHRYAHVAYGTLTDAPSLLPSAHIFVGSKAPWDEIADDLPQFDELPE